MTRLMALRHRFFLFVSFYEVYGLVNRSSMYMYMIDTAFAKAGFVSDGVMQGYNI
jgi:hypothetical protein